MVFNYNFLISSAHPYLKKELNMFTGTFVIAEALSSCQTKLTMFMHGSMSCVVPCFVDTTSTMNHLNEFKVSDFSLEINCFDSTLFWS